MASLKDIQRQIKSVKNTQKTTNAMKLVSTSKLKKAEDFQKHTKRLAVVIEEMAKEISKVSDLVDLHNIPVLRNSKDKDVKVVDIIFVTADKGLCGAFNINVLKRVRSEIEKYEKSNIKVRIRGLGKKGVEYFKFNKVELHEILKNQSSFPNSESSFDMISGVVDDYINGKTDRVMVIYNEFINLLSNRVQVKELLPLNSEEMGLNSKASSSNGSITIESYDQIGLLNRFVKKFLQQSFYFILINSLTAEHSSRMQAMDSASKNASEMVMDLQLKYNKHRQEAITKELIEIIGGVESMK